MTYLPKRLIHVTFASRGDGETFIEAFGPDGHLIAEVHELSFERAFVALSDVLAAA